VLKKNQRFLLNLGALSPSLFLDFSQHVTDIILNEYSRNTENALFEWLGKDILILRNQIKIKNVWKLSLLKECSDPMI
jgi:hypothetical protein